MSKFAQTASQYSPLTHNNAFGEEEQTDYNVSVSGPSDLFGGSPEGAATLTLIDGDTFTDTNGNKYRLAGATAPETAKVSEGPGGLFDGTGRTIEIDRGEAFGNETMQAVNAVIQQGGFNKLQLTGEESYDRQVARLMNDKGQDLTTELYRSGVLKPTTSTSKDYVDAYNAGEMARKMGINTGYEDIVNEMDSIINSQTRKTDGGVAQFSQTAFDEYDAALINEHGAYHNQIGGLEFDNPDVTIDNMARNSIGASAYAGWQGMKEGAYGFAQMIGEELGIDVVKEWGDDGLTIIGDEKARMPGIENLSFHDVNSFTDGLKFIANNTAMSLPYLGLIAGGSLLAPLTGGGSLGAAVSVLPAASVYSGQIWTEMEGEKNAGAALVGGVLAASIDKLGFSALIKPSQLLTKEGMDIATNALIQSGKATSKEGAEQLILNTSKREVMQLLKHQAAVADGQLGSMVARNNLVKDLGKRAAFGGASESVTEAAQETLQYMAAVQGSDREYNQWELEDRVRDAMLAAFGPGAGFSGAASIIDTAGKEATFRDLQKAEIDRLNAYEQIRENARREGKPIPTVDQILDKVQAKRRAWDAEQEALRLQDEERKAKGKKKKRESRIGSFARRADKHQANERGFYNTFKNLESIPDAVSKAVTGMGKLWNAASVTAFKPTELANADYGHILQEIRALVGQGRGVINPGRSFEAREDFLYSKLAQQVYMPEILGRFGKHNQLTQTGREDISKMLRAFGSGGYYDAMVNDKRAPLPPEMEPYREALFQTAKELETMANNIRQTQIDAQQKDGNDEGFGDLEGWWWKHQDLDPKKVNQNKTAFREFLKKNSDMSEEQISDFIDRVIGGDTTLLEDYFSHVRGIEFEPGHQKARAANLSEKEGYEMFAQDNIFLTMDSAAMSAARYASNLEYFGAGGRNLDILFDELQEAGMPEDKINEVAWYTKSIIDSAAGNYNRVVSPRMAGLNKFASTWSIFAGLPLAALSSLPESALITLGLDSHEVAAAANKMAKETAGTFAKSMQATVRDALASGNLMKVPEGGFDYEIADAQNKLNNAGLLWTPASAGKRIGVGEVNIAYSWYQDLFFKATGLTTVTQAQRRASAAIATDFVANRLSELAEVSDWNNLTNRQQHVYNQLAELGMEVERMVKLWEDNANDSKLLDYTGEQRNISPEAKEVIDRNMQDAVYNFVNMRIQNPKAANRPLFFQDPHWQLMTQFNGFIATFTANVVPKLWADYVARGAPQVKYNTFATIVLMMGMGGASQYLKDYIKYGRVTPYLNSPQQFQRAIYGSGVLGQAERAVEAVMPIYGGEYHGTLAGQLWGIATGEAGPAIRNVETVAGAAYDATQGDYERAVDKITRVTPGLGPLTGLRKGLTKSLFGGNIGDAYREYDEM